MKRPAINLRARHMRLARDTMFRCLEALERVGFGDTGEWAQLACRWGRAVLAGDLVGARAAALAMFNLSERHVARLPDDPTKVGGPARWMLCFGTSAVCVAALIEPARMTPGLRDEIRSGVAEVDALARELRPA